MKSAWSPHSENLAILSGVATFYLVGGEVDVTFKAFQDYHAFTLQLQREIDNAVRQGRSQLLSEIRAIPR